MHPIRNAHFFFLAIAKNVYGIGAMPVSYFFMLMQLFQLGTRGNKKPETLSFVFAIEGGNSIRGKLNYSHVGYLKNDAFIQKKPSVFHN